MFIVIYCKFHSRRMVLLFPWQIMYLVYLVHSLLKCLQTCHSKRGELFNFCKYLSTYILLAIKDYNNSTLILINIDDRGSKEDWDYDKPQQYQLGWVSEHDGWYYEIPRSWSWTKTGSNLTYLTLFHSSISPFLLNVNTFNI